MIHARIAALAALGAIVAMPALAQTGMGLIGERVVNGTDHDSIPARGTDRYQQILICVENAPVAFQEVVVRFRNGTSQNVRLRARIAAGRCSREIDIGRDRDIQSIDFTYAPAAPNTGPPTVQVYAR
jgi:hypothetical protein